MPVPATDLYAPPLTVLVTSNPPRRLEAWLERGGIDDSNPVDRRGERYETSYCRSICIAIDENTACSTARCAPDGIKKNKAFDEQIDLLVSFGDLALVGELKFFRTPADPHERARYFDKLEKAGDQALRKTAALDARRDVVASALGITTDEAQALTPKPIVVTNQGFAFSLEVRGAKVVDAGFLRTYLGDGTRVSGMATLARTNAAAHAHHRFHSTEMAARQQFAAEMDTPYVLTRFLDRMKFRTSKMPTLAGPDLAIIAAYAGKLEGNERERAVALIAALQP